MYGNLLKSWVPDVLSGDSIITSSRLVYPGGLVYPGLCCIQVGVSRTTVYPGGLVYPGCEDEQCEGRLADSGNH